MAVDKKTMWAFIGLASMLTVGIVMMVVSSFKGRGSGPAPDSVTLTVPDGEIKEVPDSKSAAMRGAVSLDKYFAELDEDEKEGEDVSLVSGDPAEKAASEPRAAESDEAVVARTFGVPAPSEEPSRPRASSGGGHRSGGGSSARPMTPEEKLEYDRKRAEMVRDVLNGGTTEEPVEEETTEPEARRVDLSSSSSDGIISYLDDEPASESEVGIRPFRCMFVRDQKLVNGQRLTLRLLEDLTVDGVSIPANTHLSAICKIGDRLELSVRSLELGGRIVPLSLEAYDGDGLPGIYCPETTAAKNSRKASDDAISTAGRTFGGLVGDIANTVIRTGATIAKSATGEVSVNVVSGYEFYLVKVEKR